MDYRPMPLLDFEGMSLEREPMISPQNSWRMIKDGYVYRGRLRKRQGASFKQQLGVAVTGEAVGIAGSVTYAYKLLNLPFVLPTPGAGAGEYQVRFTANTASGVETIVVGSLQQELPGRSLYNLTIEGTTADVSGFISWSNDTVYGTAQINFSEVTTGPVTVDYEWAPQNPVMGIETFIYTDGTEYNLAFDTERVWLLDDTEERYYCITPSVTFSGTDTDHFHLSPFSGILVINNGVDVPYKYDPGGGGISAMATDVDGDTFDDINAAEMFIDYLGYGVYLGVNEAGGWSRGRARWTQNGNAEVFNAATDFLDAPANDVIVSAAIVGADLLVGFRDNGWWKLESTNNAFDPFRWVPTDSDYGAVAMNGTVVFSDRLITRNRYGLGAVNRMGDADAALPIGDLPLQWSADNAYLTQSVKYDGIRQVWWTYADQSEDVPEHILVMQREPGGSERFSIYDIALHSIGSYRIAGSPTWDSIDTPWDDIDYEWDTQGIQGGFPRVVGGDTNGWILEFRGETTDKIAPDDSGSPVRFAAKTIRINPFPGQRVRLGWIDIIAERNPNASLEVRLYADFESAAYFTETVALDDGTSGDKVNIRINVNQIALFHTIEVLEETNSNVSIDYIAPWMKPEGDMRETG